MKKTAVLFPGVTSFIMLLAAIPEGFSYDYYVLLRCVVCFSAIFIAWDSHKNQKINWLWPMGLIAVLFNPLIPFQLARTTWIIVDLISSATFLSFLIKENRKI